MSDDSASDHAYADSDGSDFGGSAPVRKPAKKPAASKARALKPIENGAVDSDGDTPPPSKTKPKTAKRSRGDNGKTVEEIYQKKTQLEHILLRPDTYIGSVEAMQTPMWVFEDGKFVHRSITYVPGLYKIFDEILVNAADNKIRDPEMDTIKVTIDQENNTISIMNNGRGIPIEMHKEEQVYVPELIFGYLLTSSNYNDSEKKVVGGRNGFGAKLCNIFSTEFTVETADSRSGQKFKQVFSNNMSSRSKPSITDNKKGDDYTKITFKPDLAKFHMESLDNDIAALLRKRVYDMAGCVKDIKVFLNGERLKVKDFKQYVQLYLESASRPDPDGGAVAKPPLIHEIVNDRWEVAVSLSDGQFNQVSFVNSISTSKGGTHVNYIADQMVTRLMEAVKKKNKAAPIKPFQVKSQLWLFINCLVENPSFDSQTKENMTLRASAFGSKCLLSDEMLKKVLKSGVVENLLTLAKAKQDIQLKKMDGGKKQRISGITKLDDANNAGTKRAADCTLILTEGDSAKTLAVSGLSIVGRDNYGVFPLRGKLLNVREATHTQIMNNAEISNIKQIMGLQHGKSYVDVNSLRYGHLMIMTDQDHDGSHIKGLIINFLDHFFPSLLKIPGFLLEFITPIVKCRKGNRSVAFFTLPEYEEWKRQNQEGRGWHIKYYKGLGTSGNVEAKEYFSALNVHKKPFKPCTPEEKDLIDMAFSKKRADHRKEWLAQFQPGTYMDHTKSAIPINEFINKELILFSMADNVRSIPSAVDGLKPGQRKILYACFKRNLKNEIKVAQLGGYVSEHSAYHHGEQSLYMTIVGMAQDFVGSNNINLLEPCGQFGTRLQGGKDAASPRYIFTNLASITRKVFCQPDMALLDYQNDDGQMIEPQWYIPVVPMVLINGGEGIGTGWSTSIPNYNPRDVVDNLKRLMRGETMQSMHPWYRGFNGTIEQIAADKYRVSGIIRKLDDNTLEVTELPVGTWTQSFKEMLEEMVTGTEKTPAFIRNYNEYHTDATVHFIITMSPESMRICETEGLDKKFKMTTTLSTSNMVCFDQAGRICKYAAPEDIMRDFYQLRLRYYQKRKEHLVDQLHKDHSRLANKVRFIREIIGGTLKVQNKKRKDLVVELRQREYTPFPKTSKASSAAIIAGATEVDGAAGEEADDADAGTGNADAASAADYDYLLSMPIWSLTHEKVVQLENELKEKKEELDYIISLTPTRMWEIDLDSFLLELEQNDEERKEREAAKAKKGAAGAAAKSRRSNGKAPAKKATSGAARKGKAAVKKESDDDDDDDDDGAANDDSVDEDDDFEPPKKVQQAAKAPRKPRAKAADATPAPAQTQLSFAPVKTEPVKKETAAAVQIDDNDDLDLDLEARIAKLMGARKGNSKSTAAPVTLSGVSSQALSPGRLASTSPLGSKTTSEPVKLPVKRKTAAAATKSAAKPKAASAAKRRKVADESEEDDKNNDDDDDDMAMAEVSAPPTRARGARAKTVVYLESDGEEGGDSDFKHEDDSD
ncbi:DNA topoisomerase 2 [Sorochytrium milnesiophthora]